MTHTPTKTGLWPWRKTRECYCMLFDFQNPHGWVRAYCPPVPTPRIYEKPGKRADDGYFEPSCAVSRALQACVTPPEVTPEVSE